MSNKREWSNCFIKTNLEILLDLADFAFQEEPVHCTMTAKPIKSLEMHYTNDPLNRRKTVADPRI